MAVATSRVHGQVKIKGTTCTVNLPTDGVGELEWATVGEDLATYITEEVDSASKIDFKYGTGTKRGRKPQTGWKYLHEKHDVMVFKKRVSRSPITVFMGRGVLDVPLQDLAEFVKGVENNMAWDDLLIEARYLKVLSESDTHTDYLGYQQFESTSCYVHTRRDMLYYVRCLHKEDMYIQAALSVDNPEYPVPDGVKRIEVFRGSGFVLEPYQGSASQTLVTYLAHIDPKGIPLFMMNHVLQRHPMAIHHIRRQFVTLATSPTPDNGRASERREKQEGSTADTHSLRHSAVPSDYFEEALTVGEFMH